MTSLPSAEEPRHGAADSRPTAPLRRGFPLCWLCRCGSRAVPAFPASPCPSTAPQAACPSPRARSWLETPSLPPVSPCRPILSWLRQSRTLCGGSAGCGGATGRSLPPVPGEGASVGKGHRWGWGGPRTCPAEGRQRRASPQNTDPAFVEHKCLKYLLSGKHMVRNNTVELNISYFIPLLWAFSH